MKKLNIIKWLFDEDEKNDTLLRLVVLCSIGGIIGLFIGYWLLKILF